MSTHTHDICGGCGAILVQCRCMSTNVRYVITQQQCDKCSKPALRVTDKQLAEAVEHHTINIGFVECDACRAQPGSPTLCNGCRHNRHVIWLYTSIPGAPTKVLEDIRRQRASGCLCPGIGVDAAHNCPLHGR